MNSAPQPQATPALRALAPGFAVRFDTLITNLLALIAHAFLKHPRHARDILALWRRLRLMSQRFTRLMARIAENRPPRAPSARVRHPRAPSTEPTKPHRFPRTNAWLRTALLHHGVCHAGVFDTLLNDPDLAALIAHSQTAARILRPLARMLGLTLPPLPQPTTPTPTKPAPTHPTPTQTRPRPNRTRPRPISLKFSLA